jgi:hypothetical protein
VQSVANANGITEPNGNCYCDCDRHGYSDGNCNCYANSNCHSHGDRYGYWHSNGDSGTEGYSITETSSDTTAPTVRLIDRRSVIS